jgi:hypothetical protein
VDSRAQAELLEKQCKKHQILREPMPEAIKQAKAAVIYLELAELNTTDDDQRQDDLKRAAELLSRAKRQARKLSKGPRDEEDDDP